MRRHTAGHGPDERSPSRPRGKERGIGPIWPVLLLLPVLAASFGCAGRSATPQELQMAEWSKQASPQAQEQWHKEEPRPNHLELARQLVARGLYQVALGQLEQARESETAGCEVFFLTGKCHLELGSYEQAGVNFRRAIALDARHAPSYNGLGLVHDRSGAREKAWEAYGKAIELNPAGAEFHSNLGFSKLLAGRPREAESHLRASLKLSPNLEVAVNNLAFCCALQGRYGEAHALLQAHGSPAAVLNNLGVFFQLNGDLESAARHYQSALKTNQDLREARENLTACGGGPVTGEPIPK